MQLRVARLCLDCEEIHDAQSCPLCASEAFVYLTRWVPAPDRRVHPKPFASTAPKPSRPAAPVARKTRWIGRSVLGLTAIGLVGWVWRRGRDQASP